MTVCRTLHLRHASGCKWQKPRLAQVLSATDHWQVPLACFRHSSYCMYNFPMMSLLCAGCHHEPQCVSPPELLEQSLPKPGVTKTRKWKLPVTLVETMHEIRGFVPCRWPRTSERIGSGILEEVSTNQLTFATCLACLRCKSILPFEAGRMNLGP